MRVSSLPLWVAAFNEPPGWVLVTEVLKDPWVPLGTESLIGLLNWSHVDAQPGIAAHG